MTSLRVEDLERNFPRGPQAALLRVISSKDVGPAWEEWQSTYDLKDVEIYRLIPALYFRLQEAGIEGGRYLRGVVRHAYAAGALQKQVGREMVDRLSAAQIPTLALKGLALALHLGYAPRHMSDIDLLIPRDRVDQAVDIVMAAGWVPDFGVTAEDVKLSPEVAHGWGFRRGVFQFDLHWCSVHQDQGRTFDEAVWRGSVKRGGFQVPSKTHLMFQLVLHGIRQYSPALVWPADLYSLLKAPGEIAWEDLFQLAEDRRLLVQLHVLLRALSPYMEVPSPPPRLITPIEVLEHRDITSNRQESRVVQDLANYRKRLSGRIPPYNALFFRTGRSPASI